MVVFDIVAIANGCLVGCDLDISLLQLVHADLVADLLAELQDFGAGHDADRPIELGNLVLARDRRRSFFNRGIWLESSKTAIAR